MGRQPRVLVVTVLLATFLGACTAESGQPDPSVLNTVVAAAQAQVLPADVPPPDAHLAPALWDQAAAWAARESQAGRPVVINLFASWCGPCRAEAPLLRQAIEAHPDVAFLLVDHLDRLEEGEAFLTEEGLGHVPSLFDDLGDIAAALQARGMPATAFFAANGDLVGVVNGVLTEPVLAQRLADLEATMTTSGT